VEKAAAQPARNSSRTAGRPPPRRAVAVPITKAPPLVEPKSAGGAKLDAKIIQERAARIRIIEEREPRIEVIQ
jgi:hypothetical protein